MVIVAGPPGSGKSTDFKDAEHSGDRDNEIRVELDNSWAV